MTKLEEEFFQTVANMMWKGGVINRPNISRLSKMALNVIGNQYIQHIQLPEHKKQESRDYVDGQTPIHSSINPPDNG